MKQLLYRCTRHLRFRMQLRRQWRQFQDLMHGDPLAALRADLRALVEAPSSPRGSKGQPDLAALKRVRAQRLLAALEAAPPERLDAEMLATARSLAALEPKDDRTQRVHRGLFCLAHAEMLDALRRHLRRHVVVHISCRARIDRATASCRSFEPALDQDLSQLTVVGSGFGEFFAFDAERQLLSVPASDAYEHLPSKVAAACFVLGLVEQVEAVLKVDDDHRLRSAERLRRTFRALDPAAPPLQLGRLYFVDHLGAHNRAWHIGKSSDPALNDAPYGYPGARQWASGHAGYFLNRSALRLAGWAYTHFRAHFHTGVYEDIVLSDLIERLGGRLRHTDMAALLAADASY